MKKPHTLILLAFLGLAGCADAAMPEDDGTRTEPDTRPDRTQDDSTSDDSDDEDTDFDFDNDDVVDPDDVEPDPEPTEDCTDGAERTCYTGPAGTEGVGTCAPGVEVCSDGQWGGCEDQVVPGVENPLNGLDDDCNGEIDETLTADAALTGGHWHSCFLHASGAVYCWGHNEYGQIGNGTYVDAATPTAVLGSTVYDHLEAGYMFNCALSGGQARCWGRNEYGQIGDGTTTNRNLPVQVDTPISFQQLSAGNHHVCGLTTNGRVACWGSNEFGQIGPQALGTTFTRPQALDLGVELVSITAGQLHNCGLDTDGRAYCWGYNGHGQVGNGSDEPFETTPVRVGDELHFSQLSAGYRHTCGVTISNGEVWCWGRNPAGQLGNGTQEDSSVPVKVNLKEPVQQVFTGYFHTCAVTSAGTAYCWGQNVSGQLGDGTTTARSEPVEVQSTEEFVEFAMMVRSTCGRTVNDDMLCWGENDYGQFATNSPGQSTTPTVTSLP